MISLCTQIAWLRLKKRRIELLESKFIIYTLVILFIGLVLGMVWRANQVEPHLEAQIAILERSMTGSAKPLHPEKIAIDLDRKSF